jgi:hypothetical protein
LIKVRSRSRTSPDRPPAPRRTLWRWCAGPRPGPVDIDTRLAGCLRRFDSEHTYRFAKNTLGWTAPAIRTPAQADRWTWLIVVTYTQRRLARGRIADDRLPWQRPPPPGRLTPASPLKV